MKLLLILTFMSPVLRTNAQPSEPVDSVVLLITLQVLLRRGTLGAEQCWSSKTVRHSCGQYCDALAALFLCVLLL